MPPRHSPRLLAPRLLAVVSVLAVLSLPLFAAVSARAAFVQSPTVPGVSAIVIDVRTGAVLSAIEPDAPRFAASLTKLMTLYLAFQALRDHRIGLDTVVPVSAHAASMEPVKLGLTPGMYFTVGQAIDGMVTLSANDAASALGEFLGGSEPRFAQMMTLRAHAMGMWHTEFANASGLPAPGQITTARDIAILARRLILDFPQFYSYFSLHSFVFRGRLIVNHDEMLHIYPGADGLKTGFTNAAGFNLATSTLRNGVRLIGVVLHAASVPERDAVMTAMLNRGYASDTIRFAAMPHFIATAHAATLPPAPPYRPATAVRALPRPVLRPAIAHAPAGAWRVQVGSFLNAPAASRAALAARRTLPWGSVHVETLVLNGRRIWRSELEGLSRAEAWQSCADLARRHLGCLVLGPEKRRYAAR